MRQNNFYFARNIDASVKEGIDHIYAELGNENLRDDAVYIVKTEDYQDDMEFYDGLGADMMEISGHIVFKRH